MIITESVYLPTRAAWRAWLRRHHKSKREIWLIYYKKASGKPRVDYADAVEEALCFGWIDSTLKPMDAHRYAQRFTPRKPGSNWSTPNLIRVKKLVAAKLMTPAGAVHLPSARQARAFHRKHQYRLNAPTSAPPDLARALGQVRKRPRPGSHWRQATDACTSAGLPTPSSPKPAPGASKPPSRSSRDALNIHSRTEPRPTFQNAS